jgi:hypothetical protein
MLVKIGVLSTNNRCLSATRTRSGLSLARHKKAGQKVVKRWSEAGQKVDKGATASQLQIRRFKDWKMTTRFTRLPAVKD